MRSMLMVVLSLFFMPNFSANAAMYIQGEVNKVDVQSGLDGASIDGTGFGARLGYRWKMLGFEGGYTTATAKLKGQIFSPNDKYEATFGIITGGVRWWLGRWFDLSTGILSVTGKSDMSVTVPILGTISGSGKYSTTGYYLGAALNIPLNSFDIFVAYNLYRWSEKEFDGTLAGSKGDKGINTIAGGLRFTF